MTGYAVKAFTKSAYRRKNSIIIGIILLLSCAALVLAVYNFVEGAYPFTISYLIGAFLGITYTIIRINTVYKTYLATDRRSVYMRRWINKFMPYNTECRVKLLREFIPSKTELVEVSIDEIKSVYIGTKTYIKKFAENQDDFADDIAPFERSKDFTVKRTVQRMDFFYIETTDGECVYMPIMEFNSAAVIKIMKYINRRNPDVKFNIYSKAYRRFSPIAVPEKWDAPRN